ncbi:hypothetical protein KUL72_30540 [Bradyrhizobium arachidis]|nr:hypothetical protein [Bradyrhizobium arachidis]UVO40722.1 hypothetical protein KUL72_30540 [Bradyrhizobium arachidis]
MRDVPAAFASATIRPRYRIFRLRAVIGLQRGTIGFNLLLDLRESALRLDARLAGAAIKKRPVDRHQLTAQKAKFTHKQHELPVRMMTAGHQVLHVGQISSRLRPASRSRAREDLIRSV